MSYFLEWSNTRSFFNINQLVNNDKANFNKQILEQINETLRDAGLLALAA